MKTKILMVLALFFMLSGFYGEDRIVEENGVNLQVRVDDEHCAPTIIEKPRILIPDNGNSVIFMVRFKANPRASVTWYRYSLVVDEDSRHQMSLKKESGDVMTAMLEIKYPTSKDVAIYRALIKNEIGETTATIVFSL